MGRILKIDNFVKDFPSIYGLDADGTCYQVNDSFYVEVLTGYESKGTISGIPYFEPKWTKFVCNKGDVIVASKSGCYIQPKDTEGFMECRPESKSPEGEPKLEAIPKDFLTKIAKDVINTNSLSFSERNKITSSRIL